VSEANEIRDDLERTRAELADTIGALTSKLDVKSQARRRAHEAGDAAVLAYENAKASAPPEVRKVLSGAEEKLAPVAARAAEDKKRTASVVGGALVLLLLLRRVRRRSLRRRPASDR
jgi:hypothetical protein